MITVKDEKQIEYMRESCRIVKETLEFVGRNIVLFSRYIHADYVAVENNSVGRDTVHDDFVSVKNFTPAQTTIPKR